MLVLFAAQAVAAQVVEPCTSSNQKRCCGDGVCNGPETIGNCFADCPGVTTAEYCGEEPHSYTGGAAVVFGINQRYRFCSWQHVQ